MKPRPGFDWLRVNWGAPDEPASDRCSYCDEPIPVDAFPLRLWRVADGWAAVFCDDCMAIWWEMTT